MTSFKEKFTELDGSVKGRVHFGDGSTVDIMGKGTFAMLCKNGEQKLLNDVYYIPNLCNNIISLGLLSEGGNRVELNGDFLWVYDELNQLLMKVKRSSNRLYKITIETNKREYLISKADEMSQLWHMRLGHVNYQAIQMMAKEKMVKGLQNKIQPIGICDGCLVSKQAKKNPAKATYEDDQVLKLVHGDLCGPISPGTASGFRYFFPSSR